MSIRSNWLPYPLAGSNPNMEVAGTRPAQTQETPEPAPLDKVKTAILELRFKDQREIYKFLYALGHRIG